MVKEYDLQGPNGIKAQVGLLYYPRVGEHVSYSNRVFEIVQIIYHTDHQGPVATLVVSENIG